VKKILLLLLDGVGDRCYDELGGSTPLESAPTPNLDRLADLGASASVYPVEPGLVAPSEIPHFHLFGYAADPFPGRAVLESLGFGVEPPREAAVAHLGLRHVTPGPSGLALTDWWPGSEEADARELVASICAFEHDAIRMEARYLGKSDSLLVMHSGSEFITDADPFLHTGLPVLRVAALEAAPDPEAARATADALNAYLRWTHRVLRGHPANRRRAELGKLPLNMAVTKWPGRHHRLKDFRERSGMRGAIIASLNMYAGMAAALGMGHRHVCGGEDPAKEIADKLEAAREAFASGAEFVHLHTKAADEAAHTRSAPAKRDAIAQLDRGLSSLWDWPGLGEDYVVAVTADHATPSHGPMLHSGESVPLVVMGRGIRRDRIAAFGEREAVGGALGQLRARDVLPVLLNAANRARFLGGRASASAGFGVPQVTPLTL
jgi:2,3-bisphosphoglycerate-independent phosphoglycerate mutase